MSKAQLVDGVPHRVRRGKLVPIPAEWLGKIMHEQTKRKRKRKGKS